MKFSLAHALGSPGGSGRASRGLLLSIDPAYRYGGTLGSFRHDQHAGSDLAAAGSDLERPYLFDQDRPPVLRVHVKVALLGDMAVQDAPLMNLAIRPRKPADQEDLPVLADFNFPLGQVGNPDQDGPPTGAFHDSVHQFLWECVEHDGANPLTLADLAVQSLKPALPVLGLTFSPLADKTNGGFHLLAGFLPVVETQHTSRLLQPEESLFPGPSVVLHALEDGFGLLRGLRVGFLFFPHPSKHAGVDPGDLRSFPQHLLPKPRPDDQAAEGGHRKVFVFGEKRVNLFPHRVIEFADHVAWSDSVKVQRQ